MIDTSLIHRIGEVFELKTSSDAKVNSFNENDSHTELPSDASECNGILSTNSKSPIHNTSSLLGREKDTNLSKDEYGYNNGQQISKNEGNIRLYLKCYVYSYTKVHI